MSTPSWARALLRAQEEAAAAAAAASQQLGSRLSPTVSLGGAGWALGSTSVARMRGEGSAEAGAAPAGEAAPGSTPAGAAASPPQGGPAPSSLVAGVEEQEPRQARFSGATALSYLRVGAQEECARPLSAVPVMS